MLTMLNTINGGSVINIDGNRKHAILSSTPCTTLASIPQDYVLLHPLLKQLYHQVPGGLEYIDEPTHSRASLVSLIHTQVILLKFKDLQSQYLCKNETNIYPKKVLKKLKTDEMLLKFTPKFTCFRQLGIFAVCVNWARLFRREGFVMTVWGYLGHHPNPSLHQAIKLSFLPASSGGTPRIDESSSRHFLPPLHLR